MIRSMTAYGHGEYELNKTRFSAEIKSLNNRYRDIIIRLPVTLQGLEDEIRTQISSRVGRGRIEITLQVEKKGDDMDYGLEINLPLLRSYMRIFRQMGDEFGIDEKIRPDFLCQMRDMIIMKPEEINLNESREGVHQVIGLALDSMDAMRSREGSAIEEDFLKRLDLIERYLDEIEKRSPRVVEDYKEKLKQRIENIADDIKIDEGRLAQEVAIFAGRCDITEEIVRARSHLAQFRKYLSMGDPIGRRLDFLIQEINREINTISAKASDSSISANAVEVKAELEKLREQIQNVE